MCLCCSVWLPMNICIQVVYTCLLCVCVCLLGMQAQHSCWLDLGAWSCYNLMSIRTTNSSANEEYIVEIYCSGVLPVRFYFQQVSKRQLKYFEQMSRERLTLQIFSVTPATGQSLTGSRYICLDCSFVILCTLHFFNINVSDLSNSK